jgi:uncharacterized protein (DUF427 family)
VAATTPGAQHPSSGYIPSPPAGARSVARPHPRSAPESADPPAATRTEPAKQSRQKPLAPVDQTLLADSATRTYCPYKGDASYYNIVLPDGPGTDLTDAVWSYRELYDFVASIAGHIAFYTDRVEVVVDEG